MLLQVRVARDKPLLRAAGKHAAATATAAAAANSTHILYHRTAGAFPVGSGAAAAVRLPVMLGVAAVAGVHHFSGSWLGLDGSKSLSLRKEVRGQLKPVITCLRRVFCSRRLIHDVP
jgi:hypothetical protein